MHQQLLKSPFTVVALSALTFLFFSSFFLKAAHCLKVTEHLGNLSYNETCVHFFPSLCVIAASAMNPRRILRNGFEQMSHGAF